MPEGIEEVYGWTEEEYLGLQELMREIAEEEEKENAA